MKIVYHGSKEQDPEKKLNILAQMSIRLKPEIKDEYPLFCEKYEKNRQR